jgi:hypothetical protein
MNSHSRGLRQAKGLTTSYLGLIHTPIPAMLALEGATDGCLGDAIPEGREGDRARG